MGLLALGCRGRAGDVDAGVLGASASSTPDAAGAAGPADAGACHRRPDEVQGPYVDLCLSPVEVEAFAATVRDALLRHDAAKMASLVRYPFRVHAAPCTKQLVAPADLVARYDEVFTPALQGDILDARPPFFVRDGSIELARAGKLWAWVGNDGRVLLGGVFLGKGDLADVPCANRVPEAIPESVWGTWEVSSVRAGALEDLVSFPWQDWKRLTLSLDRATRTLTTRIGARRKECTIVSFYRDTSPEFNDASAVRPCSAFETFWGSGAEERARTLQLSCPGGDLAAGEPRSDATLMPELLVLGDGNMVVRLACEGIAILKKRSGPGYARPRRVVPEGAPCGTHDVDCAPNARCVAVSAHPLTEVCKGLNEHAE